MNIILFDVKEEESYYHTITDSLKMANIKFKISHELHQYHQSDDLWIYIISPKNFDIYTIVHLIDSSCQYPCNQIVLYKPRECGYSFNTKFQHTFETKIKDIFKKNFIQCFNSEEDLLTTILTMAKNNLSNCHYQFAITNKMLFPDPVMDLRDFS